jgi:diadenosine tetraphosphate (Ap4A) HIT family hydrolase
LHECPYCNPCSFENQKIILENDHCMFLQMPQEILIGSGLIIPKEHRKTVFDLTEDEWISTLLLLQSAKKLVDEQYNPDGYNIGWNCYETGGQSIPHAHLHVVPRYKDEPFSGKGIRHWIKSKDNKRNID